MIHCILGELEFGILTVDSVAHRDMMSLLYASLTLVLVLDILLKGHDKSCIA